MYDEDDYVQKDYGWLLKATARIHSAEVAAFVRRWHGETSRATFRSAIEGMDRTERAALIALRAGAPGRQAS